MSTTYSEPAPGSARAKAAEYQAAAEAIPFPPEATAVDMSPVPVTGTPRAANGDEGSASTVSLSSANPYRLALPQDPQRYRAVLIASASSVYLCGSREAAMEVGINGSTTAGGALPAGVPVELRNKAQWWVADSTPATACTVTVIVERYADLEPC